LDQFSPLKIDDALIRASQSGDRSAFEKLLVIIYDVIFRFALRWVHRVADAEDITQQVCMKLARVIKQFRFESAFTTWLYKIVLNAARDWSRAQARAEEIDAPQEASSSGQGEASAELQRVVALVDNLGKGFKDTLLLVYGEGLTHKEAAVVLGVKESTVSWRIHEMKKHLKSSNAEAEK
jgi:RNA polymerase sigma-70 factor (ECF subfamily)